MGDVSGFFYTLFYVVYFRFCLNSFFKMIAWKLFKQNQSPCIGTDVLFYQDARVCGILSKVFDSYVFIMYVWCEPL